MTSLSIGLSPRTNIFPSHPLPAFLSSRATLLSHGSLNARESLIHHRRKGSVTPCRSLPALKGFHVRVPCSSGYKKSTFPLSHSRFGVCQKKSYFGCPAGADFRCRAHESGVRRSGWRDLCRRGFKKNLTSSKQLSCPARARHSYTIRKEQSSFGHLFSKVATFPVRKTLICQSYQGDASEPPPEDWEVLEQAIQFQAKEETRLFFSGPATGDLAEIEAFCRLYRHAERLQSTVMDALRSYSTMENLDIETLGPHRGDVSLVEENVASSLAHLMALLHEGKSEFLGVRTTSRRNLTEEASPDDLPPFASFRKEVRESCKALEDALESLLTNNSNLVEAIQKRILKLKNTCLDAGFPRPEGIPSHADIPNLAPVRLRPSNTARTLYKDEDVAFWRGGHITEVGLEWLVNKGFKMIVDLREGSAQPIAQSALPDAVASGKLELIRMPVDRGRLPSNEQVEEFSRLVADDRNRPLYLHTKAGVGRASAMVSRWRETVLRRQLQFSKERKKTGNETLVSGLELVIVEDVVRISQEDALTLEIRTRRSEKESLSAGVASESQEANREEITLPSSSGVEELTSADKFGETESVQNHSSLFNLTKNALEAQRPVPKVFSRKEISKFLKRSKTPKLFTARIDKEIDSLSPALNSTESLANGNIAGVANRWGLTSPSNARDVEGQDKNEERHQVDVNSSPTSGSYDETTVKSNGDVRGGLVNGNSASSVKGTDRNKEQKKEEFGNLSESPSSGMNGSVFKVPADQGVTDEGDEQVRVEGDMCASKTGVVRLQSRKKAEMFLVRTDGYSCTRERVKESTLAFTHPSTQQQMLMWKTPPRTVMLLKKLGSELMDETQEVATFLHHQEGINIVVEPEVHDQLARVPGFGFVQTFYNQDTSGLHERVDFVVCLGGDGVILHASNLFRNAVPPVVSFNLGSLGFLTSHSFIDYKQDLQAIIHGHSDMMTGVYITLRMRLRCELYRNGKAIPGKVFDVLNEVVVDRGSNPYLCKIECYERNRLITKVQADGVIVATPTGSTAYSTAAGGSMVHPNVPCMLFTPICPHSLSFRPVILPDSALLELKVPQDARNNAWVSFDGKKRQQLSKGDSVRISMSEHPLPTVNKSDQTDDWFQSLVRCLNWNERLEQRPLSIS